MVKLTDPIADMLIRIKNGYLARAKTVSMPYSKLRQAIAAVLVADGYLADQAHKEDQLVVSLKYTAKAPAVTNIQRVSKPGRRVYTSIKSLPRVLGGLGLHILSTSAGVMSEKQARKLNLGGEILARVW